MKHPNIVFVYVDDQAAWTVGAYGNKQSHTPNLDRLASEGALLENAFCSSPVCSPARAAMMTGRYSSELGIPDFIPHRHHPAYQNGWDDVGLPLGTVTFPAVLASKGYETALIGKWHIGDWSDDAEQKFHPTKHGYQSFFGMTSGGVSARDPEFEEDGELRTFEGYCDDILTDRAEAFLQERAGSDRPFLLSLHLRQPHHPWEPVPDSERELFEDVEIELPETDHPNLDAESLKEKMRGYLCGVAGVDRMVGRVLSTLESCEMGQDTLVIFSSDHGFNMGHNGIHHKGNGIWGTRQEGENPPPRYRPNLYDNSLRVPAILRWPAKIPAGLRLSQLVSDVDWFPTVLELAGCEMQDQVLGRGESFARLVLGEADLPWRTAVYAEYDMCVYERARLRSLRTDRWKLVADFHAPWRSEFYDMTNDPGETKNLIGGGGLSPVAREEIRHVISQMASQLMKQMREHDDPLAKSEASWADLWADLPGGRW